MLDKASGKRGSQQTQILGDIQVIQVQVKGLEELRERMGQWPDKLDAGMEAAMTETLLVMHESVPGYPTPPSNSSYRRTGTLGRTLGSSFEGGGGGTPEIFTVTKIGPYVIGDNSQAKVHKGRWWVLSEVAEKARPKIERTWQRLADAMANFLEGK
jgi:hypothetical protein